MSHPTDNSPELNSDEENSVQKVVGTFFYYARAVDPKILVVMNTIAAEKSRSTQ